MTLTARILIGHYVNYRKQAESIAESLLPEDNFRLYGVSARFPQQLASAVPLQQLQPGVYQCVWGTDVVRLLVVRDLPREQYNAMLHLFSAVPDQIQYARQYYQQRSGNDNSGSN